MELYIADGAVRDRLRRRHRPDRRGRREPLGDCRRPDRRGAQRGLPRPDTRPSLPRPGHRRAPVERRERRDDDRGRRRDPRRDHGLRARRRGHGRPAARGQGASASSRPASRPRSSAATTRTRRSSGWPSARARPSGGCRCCSTATRSTRAAAGCSSSTRPTRELAVENAEMQDEEGLDSVEVDDLQEYLPGADETGIAYALYEPDAGFADPVATTNAYITAARRPGGASPPRARRSSRIELERRAGPRRAASAGELLECDNVVLAAGPWTPTLAAGIGLDLPLEITREQDVVFDDGTGADDSRRRSPRRSTGSTCGPRPSTATAHLLVGRGFPKEYEHVDAGRLRRRGRRRRSSRTSTSRVSTRLPRLAGHAPRRRPRRPLRRHARTGIRSSARSTATTGSSSRPAAAATASSSARRSASSSPAASWGGDRVTPTSRDFSLRALRRGPRVPLDLRRQPRMTDLVIRGGTILDGTGGEPFAGDVAIEGGRHRRRRLRAAGRVPRDRRRRALRRARVHRHPQPLRLHAARRPARDERDPPGRDARGGRQLRLRLLPDPRRRARAEGDLRLQRRTCRSTGGRPASTSSGSQAAKPGRERPQPRPERPAAARDGRARRPPGRRRTSSAR